MKIWAFRDCRPLACRRRRGRTGALDLAISQISIWGWISKQKLCIRRQTMVGASIEVISQELSPDIHTYLHATAALLQSHLLVRGGRIIRAGVGSSRRILSCDLRSTYKYWEPYNALRPQAYSWIGANRALISGKGPTYRPTGPVYILHVIQASISWFDFQEILPTFCSTFKLPVGRVWQTVCLYGLMCNRIKFIVISFCMFFFNLFIIGFTCS